jgi:3-methyladenine DNA glycosylase AlkC
MTLRPGDISAARVRELEGGAASKNLAEVLAMDFAVLAGTLGVKLTAADARALAGEGRADGRRLGIVARMELMGRVVGAQPRAEIERLAGHGSDTVRGWACYALCRELVTREVAVERRLGEALARVRRYADDGHFGVREWAWMAVRPAVGAEPREALKVLAGWTGDASASVRRFASEVTRPRGVWCGHIRALREDPSPGLVVLEPLRSDPSVYVQDSVSNWLNDAAKDRPAWVRGVVARWRRAGRGDAALERVCKRAVRSVG